MDTVRSLNMLIPCNKGVQSNYPLHNRQLTGIGPSVRRNWRRFQMALQRSMQIDVQWLGSRGDVK